MEEYDVVIVGAGVTGTGLAYALSCFSDVPRIALLERRQNVAQVNSNVTNNSQTLHDGGIETNMDLDKALEVQDGARLLSGYLERHAPGAYICLGKMVIGVGTKECASLAERFARFRPHFPDLRLIGRDEIARLEPKVMEGRSLDEPIVALYTEHGKAVNYQQLSETFRDRAAASAHGPDLRLEREVTKIERVGEGFVLTTDRGQIRAKVVAVCAGGISLNFAQDMGYGREYTLLPVAGSFYKTTASATNLLNGKVYTLQYPNIPFAAPHGDPAVYDRSETRFGPTALPLPMVERHRYGTVRSFVKSGALRFVAVLTLLRVLWNAEMAHFAFSNFFCELVPFFGKRLFLRRARKIVPSLRARDIKLARGAGGIRSQLVDIGKKTLAKGKDKIVGDRIIFTMAPSPGASYCLKNAMIDAETLCGWLGDAYRFDAEAMREALTGEPDNVHERVS